MANEFRTLDFHSAEYFGDTRNYRVESSTFLSLWAKGFLSIGFEMSLMLGAVLEPRGHASIFPRGRRP